ncbi:MAG: hypothetical protein H7255_22020 [Ramlibacter sp.]|nr:hypothetical protein [Ramlibacter sp.]
MLDEPLALTVHSLPVPQDAASIDSKRTTGGRAKMLMVLAVCAAPVIASYFTYYVVRPNIKSSYGELVDPQRPLPAVTATALDASQVSLQALRGQWLLVSVASGACDAACERNLYLQRQLREGLGKEKERVDWVWLVSDNAPLRPQLLPALSQATVLRVNDAQIKAWLSPAQGHALEDHLFVVDPMGNWMMRFPALKGAAVDVEAAKKIKRDFERLLRASASWDDAGRPGK